MFKQWGNAGVAIIVSMSGMLCMGSARAQSGGDLSVKLYGESKDEQKSEKKSEQKNEQKGDQRPESKTEQKAEAPAKEAAEPAASSAIIRCVSNGRVTFTNTKCEGGSAQSAAVPKAQPPANKITRSDSSATTPKPLAALTPLYETVQATSGTAGYELREECGKIDAQISRLDAQAQLALPKAEPEPNRKKREELLRKRHSLRCS